MSKESAKVRARRVLDRCNGGGHCRELMLDSSCLFMPQRYRRVGREAAGGEAIFADEMKRLLDLCNTGGICPCANVQTWIREAKDALGEGVIGQPWMKLLGLMPALRSEPVGDSFDCCGLGGIMGCRKDFHETSLSIGTRLTGKISAAAPERLATDCLGCRLQLQQMLPFEVVPPIEILRESYRSFQPSELK